MEKGYQLKSHLFVTSDFIHNFFLHNLIKFYKLNTSITKLEEFYNDLKSERKSIADDTTDAVIYDKFIASVGAVLVLQRDRDQKYDLNIQEISALFMEISTRKATNFSLIKTYLNSLFIISQIEKATQTIEEMDDSMIALIKATNSQDLDLADRVSKLSAGTPITRETIIESIDSYPKIVAKIRENLEKGHEENKNIISVVNDSLKKLNEDTKLLGD